MNRLPRSLSTAGAVVLTLGLALAGCSTEDSSSSEPEPEASALSEGMRGEQDSGEPVDGGNLTLATYSQPSSLDPAITIAAGTTGGIEMASIYDTLLRFDNSEQEFVPLLAEGIEADDDYDTFTLTLRDGVTFSNDDVLDADAVVWSQERYASDSAPEAALWNDNVKSVTATDDRTVVYELSKPWPGFPSILSSGPGMIVAKAATAGGDDAFTPIGAGPFELDRWAPDEELVVTAREDYWDGAPHLQSIRSIFLNDQTTSLESLRGGDVDMATVRDPDVVDAVVQEDLPGYVSMVAAANIALINASDDRPGSDVRVRQAMALAIDPELINRRAFEGVGLYGDQLFGDYSVWHTETDGPGQDPDRARELVEAAMADGWDGSIEYIDGTDAASKAISQAVKASLESVGMTVTIRPMRTIAEQISAIVVEGDYDVAAWGLNYREPDPFSKMFATLHSEGAQVYGMHTSAEMDSMLQELQATADQGAQVEVMDRIQQEYNESVPFLNWGPYSEYIVWDTDVHGVVGTSNSMVHLSDAWIDED